MHYRKVEGQRTNFHNRHSDYSRMMILKREKYLQRRTAEPTQLDIS